MAISISDHLKKAVLEAMVSAVEGNSAKVIYNINNDQTLALSKNEAEELATQLDIAYHNALTPKNLDLDDWTWNKYKKWFQNKSTGMIALGEKHKALMDLMTQKMEKAKVDDSKRDPLRQQIFAATDNLWDHLTEAERKQVTKKEVLRFCAREALVGMYMDVIIEDMWGPDEKTKEFVFKGYHIKFLESKMPMDPPEGINKKPKPDPSWL